VNGRPRPSDRGISLIETLVALAILAAGMLSLAQLFGAAAMLVATVRHVGAASIYAAQKLEDIRSATAGTALPATGVDYLDASGVVLDTAMTRRGTAAYTRQWSIRPLASAPGVRVVEVVVTPGRVRLVSLVTEEAP
jgi:Tfp pilus assembly protein PilV